MEVEENCTDDNLKEPNETPEEHNDITNGNNNLKENEKPTECKDDGDFKIPSLVVRKPTISSNSRCKALLKKKLIERSVKTSEIPPEQIDGETETSGIDEPEKNKISVPIPYEEPVWKGIPEERYFIEELKSGTIERVIELKNKSFISFGRVDVCDVDMAHPTVSRFHAILQYRKEPDQENGIGYYIYDLGSTHGTFLNKYRIKPKLYVRMRVGHMLKFGCSTRLFLLQGPPEDEEEESELTLTELKAQRDAKIEERKRKEEEERLLEEQERERQERLIEERGISWGMGEDADEETDLTENPYAILTNEELYIDDPKKALRMWYEREGEELHFDTERAEKGMFVCKLVLPLDDENGKEIVVETSSRSKKEAQVQCALEACRTIDKMGLLRPSKRESKKVQKRNWEENDYYDSDEDSFFDRTGNLDKKRENRMMRAGKMQETVETYDSLMEKHKAALKKIQRAEKNLTELTSRSSSKQNTQSDDVDALDAYMMSLKNSVPKKIEIKIAKDELHLLKEEECRLRQLINIAKPANMPELIKPVIAPVPEKKAQTRPVVNAQEETVSSTAQKTEKTSNDSQKPTAQKSRRVIGPTLPPNLYEVARSSEKSNGSHPKKKQKVTETKAFDEDEYNNTIWQPPKGQTGDGRTSLNEKYGY